MCSVIKPKVTCFQSFPPCLVYCILTRAFSLVHHAHATKWLAAILMLQVHWFWHSSLLGCFSSLASPTGGRHSISHRQTSTTDWHNKLPYQERSISFFLLEFWLGPSKPVLTAASFSSLLQHSAAHIVQLTFMPTYRTLLCVYLCWVVLFCISV